MIYIIGQQNTTLYKIGRTSGKVESRVKQLQTGSSSKLNIVFVFQYDEKYCSKLEKAIQRRYSYLRTVGEWFDFKDTKIEEVIETIKILAEGILEIEKNALV